MSKSRINMLLRILGALLCTGVMLDAVKADTRTLVDLVKLVENHASGQERVWEQDITITEAGFYQLQADEIEGSKETSQLSAALISGNRQVLRSDNGQLSDGVDLTVGTYKLIVSHTMPASAPWVSIKSALLHNDAVKFSYLETFIHEALTESETVLRFDLKKEDFPPDSANGLNTLLSVLDLSDIPPEAIFTQVIDSAGVVVTQAGEGTHQFTFDENAELLLYVRLAEGVNEAILNVQVAGKALGPADDSIRIERGQASAESPPDYSQVLEVPVQRGTSVSVSLRGIDLGPAEDDLGVLITTNTPNNNTYKFTPDELLSGVQESFVADADHIYIASYVKAGDMVVVVTLEDEQGKVISEHLLAADRLIDRGELTQIETFTLASDSTVQVVLFDYQYPTKFDALSAVLWSKGGIVASGNTSVEQTLPKGHYYVAVAATSSQAGVYHLSATAADIDDVATPTPDPTPTPTPDATPTPDPTPVPESSEAPRNISGSGKSSGGGGIGPAWLLILLGFGAVRQGFKRASHIQR